MKSGFTLIELLVVIAIIGILSAVVLASLNSARSKGGDAAVQSNITTIQTQAEIYFGLNNNYGPTNVTMSLCPSASGCAGLMWCGDVPTNVPIKNAVNALKAISGSANVNCYSNGTAYAVSSRLVSSSTLYWCLDSAGKVGATPVPTLENPFCP
jgi:prepilin-type N-terminal cleavage/methylation domain-containing protein